MITPSPQNGIWSASGKSSNQGIATFPHPATVLAACLVCAGPSPSPRILDGSRQHASTTGSAERLDLCTGSELDRGLNAENNCAPAARRERLGLAKRLRNSSSHPWPIASNLHLRACPVPRHAGRQWKSMVRASAFQPDAEHRNILCRMSPDPFVARLRSLSPRTCG